MSAPYQGLGPTLAECLTAEKNALTKELAQVKADHDAAHEIKDAWIAEAKEAEAERDTALRERDEAVENVAALLRDVDQLPWIPDSFRIGWRFLARLGWSSLDEPPAPAVSGTPDTGQRQRREMFDTFAPTEPTVDDLQRSPAEAGTQEDGLDALARQFKNGQTVVWGDGPTQQGAVVGFGYTIPERPGGPDRPALVVRERWGERTGHVLPSELDAHAAVSGTPDTKEDEDA